ncbi:hypothetical protein LCGC14_0969320 [marine sediment metagenome]|uniref:Uncharacterized protein n=1 Tax=marine sediment metagenome TaxID=412755 RepID=A0A0F9NC79_9ZZZZ
MGKHRQVPIKVNTFVDEGIAPVVQVLNDIEGISTFSSCEGIKGKEHAHVYFDFGQYPPKHWQTLGKLAAKLAKVLSTNEMYDTDVCLEWTGDKDNPFIAIEFKPQDTLQIARILSDHKRELVYDT